MFSATFKNINRSNIRKSMVVGFKTLISPELESIIWNKPSVTSPLADVIGVYKGIYTLVLEDENNYLLCKGGDEIRRYSKLPKSWILPNDTSGVKHKRIIR